MPLEEQKVTSLGGESQWHLHITAITTKCREIIIPKNVETSLREIRVLMYLLGRGILWKIIGILVLHRVYLMGKERIGILAPHRVDLMGKERIGILALHRVDLMGKERIGIMVLLHTVDLMGKERIGIMVLHRVELMGKERLDIKAKELTELIGREQLLAMGRVTQGMEKVKSSHKAANRGTGKESKGPMHRWDKRELIK